MCWRLLRCCCWCLLMWGGPAPCVVRGLDPFLRVVRRCPTLPHPHECSTIGAVGLSFRVRNGTGRFPHAMTTVTHSPCSAGCSARGWVVCWVFLLWNNSILLYRLLEFLHSPLSGGLSHKGRPFVLVSTGTNPVWVCWLGTT